MTGPPQVLPAQTGHWPQSIDLTFLDHKRDTVTPQSARAMSLNKRSLLPYCLENWEIQGNSASSWPASWWLLPCPLLAPGRSLMSLPLQTLSISDMASYLGPYLTLNSLLSEYPFSQYSHNGSWGFNVGILRNPVQSLCPMFSLLEFMPIFFLRWSFNT